MAGRIGGRKAKRRKLGSNNRNGVHRFQIRTGPGKQGVVIGTVSAASPSEAALFFARRRLGGFATIRAAQGQNGFIGTRQIGLAVKTVPFSVVGA